MKTSILEKLLIKDYWTEILVFFETRSYRQKQKLESYREILAKDLYKEIALQVLEGKYTFTPPLKLVINKIQTGKKKTVYLFEAQDDFLLKVTNRILTEELVFLISPACHSFQRRKGAKTAFRALLSDATIDEKFCLKTDIHNFFNNIQVTDFIKNIPQEIKSDTMLFNLINQLLMNKKARLTDGTLVEEQKGLMAGSPLSPFLSNIYLRELDTFFTERKISYTRYSDDIVVFDYENEIEKHKETIRAFLACRKLDLNFEKTTIYRAGETAIFLGFSYYRGQIDLSPISIEKMKGKIRRLSRSYHRRIKRGKMSNEEALKHFIARINRKLYGLDARENDLCWAHWFFPVINTSKSLGIIDEYIQQKLRYSITGKNNKANYREVPYYLLCESGYIPLKSAYYAFKDNYARYEEMIGINNCAS